MGTPTWVGGNMSNMSSSFYLVIRLKRQNDLLLRQRVHSFLLLVGRRKEVSVASPKKKSQMY